MCEKKMTGREILRDPLRCAMTYAPCRKGAALLLALMTAAYFVLILKLCGAMSGVAVIALCAALCFALMTGFAWYAAALEEKQPPVVVLLCLAALSMLAIGIHVSFLDIAPGRYTNTLKPMLDEMWNYELVTAMAWEDDGWSGLYQIVCALFSRLESFSQLYAIKLFDLVCHCFAAGAVMKLALLRGAKPGGAIAALYAAVIAPTMLFNAGVWAQCDATFAALTLWGFYLLLAGRPLPGCVLWGLALATKLQSAFLFPLLIVLFMMNRVQIRHILSLAAAAFVSQIAILLDGQGLYAMISRYAVQLENARWGDVGLSDNMPSVYKLMNVASVREFSGMGLYLGIACALLVVCALLRAKRPLTSDTLMLAGLLLACGLPLILPQMNARSLYLAGMLAFACAGSPRRMIAAGLIEFVSLNAYMMSIFNNEVMPMIPLSLLSIAAAVLVFTELLPALTGSADKEAQGA